MGRLKDKKVLITGGSGGIGSETARHFLQQGAQVFLVDVDEEGLKKTVQTLNNESVGFQAADVTQPDQVEAYVKAAKAHMGGINVFFNNAGVEGKVAPIAQYEVEEFEKVMAVNVKGMFLGMKYVMPVMQESGGGSIVITSSVAGLQGTPQVVAYTTSKHAVIGMMRVAALEGAAMGIRVNTVHPSPVDNRMMRSLESGFSPDDPEGAKKNFEQTIPLGRYANEEDVAKLVLFLASDESAFITGSTYTVDGGLTA
ncbi:MAG: SDR family NAD(P)-dependent oxidoreductase [Thermonemataceae bacterium]